MDPVDAVGLLDDQRERGGRRPGSGGGEAGVVDERTGGVDQVLAHGRSCQDGAALGAEGLAQREGADHVVRVGEAGLVRAGRGHRRR